MNSPSISLEIVEQAKYTNALHAQSLHIKMRDAEGKESESQFSWWSYMYFVAVCRTCVNYNSFVDLEGFLRHLNSLLKRHPSGLFSGLFIIFNVAKFCSDYVNLKPMPPAVSSILRTGCVGWPIWGFQWCSPFASFASYFQPIITDHFGFCVFQLDLTFASSDVAINHQLRQ